MQFVIFQGPKRVHASKITNTGKKIASKLQNFGPKTQRQFRRGALSLPQNLDK
jgi:hypothetical protein